MVGMDAKDRKIEQQERVVAEQSAYSEFVAALPSQSYVRSDETGHNENGIRVHDSLHVIVNNHIEGCHDRPGILMTNGYGRQRDSFSKAPAR